ncbi:hypothetical protein [Rhodococcus jostii]|uniref:hypothetical protein n=1 Tax=Rhodococcus jostii TaxID=132919 RepID=UPI0036338D28
MPAPYDALQVEASPALLEYFLEEYTCAPVDAVSLFTETTRFLATVAVTGLHLPPSPQVDLMWHAFLADTENYRRFCHRLGVEYLHHHPTGNNGPHPHARELLNYTQFRIQQVCRTVNPRWWPPHSTPMTGAGAAEFEAHTDWHFTDATRTGKNPEHTSSGIESAHPPKGLIKRYAVEYAVNESCAEALFFELDLYLTVRGHNPHLGPPCAAVDTMWTEFLLFSRAYHQYCARLGGRLEHTLIPKTRARIAYHSSAHARTYSILTEHVVGHLGPQRHWWLPPTERHDSM